MVHAKRVEPLNTAELSDRKYQDKLRRLQQFRLMDDTFFTKCFEGDTACVQLVLRIVLDIPSLVVTDVRTQVFMGNLLDRSVRLDVLATDSGGRKFNIEIQRADQGAGRRRARYNSSMMDAALLPKGGDFEQLPETYVVFITEHDVIGHGRAVYPVERYFSGSDERFGDGTHIIYVNGAFRDDSPIGKLMHDFSCADPREMNYEVLADRMRFFKEEKEGRSIMCRVMEEMINEERMEIAKKLLMGGTLSTEFVADSTHLPLDEVKKLQTEQNGSTVERTT